MEPLQEISSAEAMEITLATSQAIQNEIGEDGDGI